MSTAAVSGARLLLCGAMGLLALLCAAAALVPGYADLQFRRADAAGVARALRLAPLDAGYLAQWSLLTADPAEAAQSLRRAVASNPWYSWAWLQLALASDDATAAESDLKKAAAVDLGFAPRWALANYYYGRDSDAPSFWYWTRAALASPDSAHSDAVGPGHAQALSVFRLAWRMSPDAATLLRRAVPDSPAIHHQFLQFLMTEHPLATPVALASDLLATAGPADVPALDAWSRTLRDAGHLPAAVALWNRLCLLHLLPLQPIGAGDGNLLTNAAFSTPPSGRTFDWRFLPTAGLEAAAPQSPGSFTVALSGNQPESWRMLSQTVPVQPGQPCVLTYRMQLDVRSGASGLYWKALAPTTALAPATPEKLLALASDSAGTLRFTPSGPLVTIALDYERPRGETRLAGSVRVESLRLIQTSPPRGSRP